MAHFQVCCTFKVYESHVSQVTHMEALECEPDGRDCSLIEDGALQHLVYHVLFVNIVVLRVKHRQTQQLCAAAKTQSAGAVGQERWALERLQGPGPSSMAGSASCIALGSVPLLPRPDNDNDSSLRQGL